MKKRTTAIILELLPIISALITFLITFVAKGESHLLLIISVITILFAFNGYVFFLIYRKTAKEDKLVKILGILDLLSTLAVVIFYIVAFYIMD